MKAMALMFGGPKAGKGGDEKPPESEGPPASPKAEAAKAVMRAIKMGEVSELEPALTAFVEACQGAGYSEKE